MTRPYEERQFLPEDLTAEDVTSLPVEQVPALVAQVAGEQMRLAALASVLLARLAAPSAQGQGREADRLLDMEAVAERLGVPLAYARELGRRGEIPTTKVGKYVRCREASLRTWMRQREEAVGAVPVRAYSSRRRAARPSPRPIVAEVR